MLSHDSDSSPPLDVAAATSLQPLPTRINIATRKGHTELNKLVVHRLSLALPPNAQTPLLYSKGFVAFSRIFVLFETEWTIILRQLRRDDAKLTNHNHDVYLWLAKLRPKGLARSDRIRNDIGHLRSVAGPEMFNTPGLGDDWIRKMRLLLHQKPHVLVAFAWVMYMAIFSGGRWIRQQLAEADTTFWTSESDKSGSPSEQGMERPLLQLPGFSFLSFDGPEDGEDIKDTFKANLAAGENLLSAHEQQEIIDTANQIFDRCIGLVKEIDDLLYWQQIWGWVRPILLVTLVPAVLVGSGWWYFAHSGLLG